MTSWLLRTPCSSSSIVPTGIREDRWFASLLTGRYSSSPETTIDYDVRQIQNQGIDAYTDTLMRGELSDAFWNVTLPQELDTAVASSPYFRVFQAAQAKASDRGFLSKDITVRELLELKSDVHHVFPRDYLKKRSVPRAQYNQIANYVLAQTEINISIGNKEPKIYFTELLEQCRGGKKRYGNICDADELQGNLRANCIPDGMERMAVEEYPAFLAERRQLMARKIRDYFATL